MATQLPAKLKSSDLGRFHLRAAQLGTARPVVAYWCEYWILNQIISRNLQTQDSETYQYTTELMNKLEEIKSDTSVDDAITDDIAGQAYVEQFGIETFLRADRAVQADKVTKQTADTFLAAATFLELVNIWHPPDPDTLSKIKYAKWNAVRIIKAIKEGQDPNATNPKQESMGLDEIAGLGPADSEVHSPTSRQPTVEDVVDDQDDMEFRLARQSTIDQSLHPSVQPSARVSPAPNRKASVEEVEDAQDQTQARLARESFLDQSLHPSAQPSNRPSPVISQASGFAYQGDDNVSPIEPSPDESHELPASAYFSSAPIASTDSREQAAPSVPTLEPDDEIELQDSHNNPSRSTALEQTPRAAVFSTPESQANPPKRRGPLNTDDAAITQAQKHARFAISALNFEDADTAVKELRAALQVLGAE